MIIDLIDKLADRLIQLLTLRKQQRSDLLEKYVSPVFSEFETVHSAYLESFSRYRQFIPDSSDQHWIPDLQATLERDNLFSANARSKVVRLAQSEQEESLDTFIAAISDYLLGARLVQSLGKEAFPHLIQRWRQSLFKTLKHIENEEWQLVIDPNGERPPMDRDEIRTELDQRLTKYPLRSGDADALKRACSMWALDEVLWEMQGQYDRVCEAYSQLRGTLSK
jgi:hypothetical protein